MKKKVISLLLTAAMATTMFAGCGSSSEENTTADNNQTAAPAATEAAAEESTEAAAPAVSADGKIAMITDSGDITDESFNQITWETCVAYGDKNGIEYQYYKPAEDTDEERINAIDLAVADGATVIVMPGYLFGPAIAEEQDLYPDVSFIAVDVTEADIVDLSGNAVGISDNVYICSFQEEQAGYLAGYAAVKDGYTSLGFLGGIAVPAVIRYGYGYIQGINDAAEEMGVDVDVKYYYGGQFYGSDAITARMDDAAVSPVLLEKALKTVVPGTYNQMSVDLDTSTNDTLIIMASGLAGNPEICEENEDYHAFVAALTAIAEHMCAEHAGDGEGATHLITCEVTHAPDLKTARAVSRSVVCSNLFKAAVFGRDANWGRILCAIGYTPGDFSIDKVCVWLSSAAGEVYVCENAAYHPYSEDEAAKVLAEHDVLVKVDMGTGDASAKAWGCDLTYDYVKINGDYRT